MITHRRLQRLAAIVALGAAICVPLTPTHAQLTAEQKAIYDVGYRNGEEAARKKCIATGITGPSSMTTIPIFAAPKPGSTTHTTAPTYFLVQQPTGLGAFEFKKNTANGEITIKSVDSTELAKLFADGKLTPSTQADQAVAVKDYFGLYQQQLKSLGTTHLQPMAVVPK